MPTETNELVRAYVAEHERRNWLPLTGPSEIASVISFDRGCAAMAVGEQLMAEYIVRTSLN